MRVRNNNALKKADDKSRQEVLIKKKIRCIIMRVTQVHN